MIMVQIPRDIRAYEPKVVGSFTGKQTIGVTLAAAIELAGTSLIKALFGQTMLSYGIPLIFAAIPLFFAFGDKMVHMPVSVYLNDVFIRSIKYPKYRPYITHNYLDKELVAAEKAEKASISDKNAAKQAKDIEQKNKEMTKNLPAELKCYK